MKRIYTVVIDCCYFCPDYRKEVTLNKEYCRRTGNQIIVKPDKEGYLIDKYCPLKEDK